MTINLSSLLGNTYLGDTGFTGSIGFTGSQGGTGFTGSQGPNTIPSAGSAKTTSYTLQVSDVGDFIEVGSGGSITIPNATFSAGDAIIIFNNTTGDITITCSITTTYIAGTDTDVASVALATRGIASILFISGTTCVILGNVS
jgi:hypothetical protein